MPSIRMKNSSMCIMGEKKGLGICQKSAMISKRSSSQASLSQLGVDFDTCTESCKPVSSSDDETLHGIGVIECVNDPKLFPEEDIESQQQSKSLVIEASTTIMDMSVDSTSANLEMIFCPVVNELEDHSGIDIHNEEGSNNDTEQPDNSGADESDGNNGGWLEYQSCNVSDFYISDVVFAGLQYDETVMGVDIEENNAPEYITAESTLLLDESGEYLSLPFLHEPVSSSPTSKVQQPEEAKLQSFDSSLFSVIHQMRPGEQGPDLDAYLNLDQTELIDSLSFIRNLPDLSDVTPTCRPTILQKESEKRKPVTLVLDLDETLVHSSMEHCENADFTFTVFFNMKEHTVYVKRRPHLHTFLERVAEMFEVFVFTASQSIYAEQLLNILDPEGKVIAGRAYRESCIFTEGIYTKDLTVLGLDLSKVIIIDNSPQVFRLQVNNGIPIKSWFDDPSDSELISLIPFLETLADVDDVRPIIAKKFGNKE